MRITEKIDLIKDLDNALKTRYDEIDIEMFFNHYKLDIDWDCWGNSRDERSINIKQTLCNADDRTLIDISNELSIGSQYIIKSMPKNWEKSTDTFKIFISHLSSQKDNAKKLKEALKPYYIDCFVAHEDIYPSLEWQAEIQKALQCMDAFISMHLEGFNNSIWCQQEIGAAIIRNVKIIPIKFDGKEDPMGFISKIQGLTRTRKDRNDLAKEIVSIIKQDPKTKDLYSNICDINEPFVAEEEIPF